MKKFLSLALALLMVASLAACGSSATTQPTSSAAVSSAASDASASNPTEGFDSAQDGKTDGQSGATSETMVEDSDMSEKLNTYMSESFGTTSWYPYINSFTVYKTGDGYTGSVSLTEEPYDYSLSILMFQYFSGDDADIVAPIILDTGAALGLDGTDLCLIAEDLSKIRSGDGAGIAYSSLSAYNIPIYSYIASASGSSESEVMANSDQLVGTDVVNVILAGLQADFSGSFVGLSMKSVNTISNSAMSNFKEAYISKITVLGPDAKNIGEYENLTSPS